MAVTPVVMFLCGVVLQGNVVFVIVYVLLLLFVSMCACAPAINIYFEIVQSTGSDILCLMTCVLNYARLRTH